MKSRRIYYVRFSYLVYLDTYTKACEKMTNKTLIKYLEDNRQLDIIHYSKHNTFNNIEDVEVFVEAKSVGEAYIKASMVMAEAHVKPVKGTGVPLYDCLLTDIMRGEIYGA